MPQSGRTPVNAETARIGKDRIRVNAIVPSPPDLMEAHHALLCDYRSGEGLTVAEVPPDSTAEDTAALRRAARRPGAIRLIRRCV